MQNNIPRGNQRDNQWDNAGTEIAQERLHMVPQGPRFPHLIASRSPTQLRLASPARTHDLNEMISGLDSTPQPPIWKRQDFRSRYSLEVRGVKFKTRCDTSGLGARFRDTVRFRDFKPNSRLGDRYQDSVPNFKAHWVPRKSEKMIFERNGRPKKHRWYRGLLKKHDSRETRHM